MTLLDRYVGRIAVGAFAAALLFFLFLLILIDLLNNISRYADRAFDAGLGGFDLAVYLGLYYLNLVPVLVTTVTPFATVIACMFAVARLQHANEVVPMLFVGRSIHRILRPMLALAVCAGLAMAGCWQWVVPRVGAALATSETFLRHSTAVQKSLVDERRGAESQYFYVREFDPVAGTVVDVRLLVQGTLAAETGLTRAERATWDAARGDWRLQEGWLHRRGEKVRQEWLGRPDLTPAVLLKSSRNTIDPEMLSYSDLREMAITRPNDAGVKLAYHRHITWPLANILLLLLVLPMAVHFERGSRISRVLFAIGLCGGYMLLDLVCQVLGQRNFVHPVVAAWVPPIFFGSLGLVLFGSTRT